MKFKSVYKNKNGLLEQSIFIYEYTFFNKGLN